MLPISARDRVEKKNILKYYNDRVVKLGLPLPVNW